MPKIPQQLEFPFFSMDFVDRSALSVKEVATKFGCSERHIHDLIDEGALGCINLSPNGLRNYRKIPIETYRDFILRNFSGELRRQFLRTLPRDTIKLLYNDIIQILNDKDWIDKK
ncbi:MAG: helix-turn-helix domain-containing protein [Opitutales bacterium]|nr:helix-turn-helix domain-containing protein [Opitutales bacterium]